MTLFLTCNAGSSSLKLALYQMDSGVLRRLAATTLDHPVDPTAALQHWWDGQTAALGLGASTAITPTAIAHRVVHGGDQFGQPVVVDAAVMESLWQLAPLAPLHQPAALDLIAALAKAFPAATQIACFDTAFHQTQPPLHRLLGLPRALHQAGIKRYGFHGLSYQYIAGQLPTLLGKVAEGRVVVAHLGSGASLCAMHRRQSVASTMGFSALDGLLMATRCGSLDAGVVLHLLNQGYDHQRLSQLLYKESGLLGVSGISGDMRDLEASSDPQAAEAVALFLHRAHQQLAAMVASLGGIDALVFTAGIGQHSAMVRSRLCQAAAWMGIELDEAVNAGARADQPVVLSTARSRVVVAMIPTDEEAVMADALADAVARLSR